MTVGKHDDLELKNEKKKNPPVFFSLLSLCFLLEINMETNQPISSLPDL